MARCLWFLVALVSATGCWWDDHFLAKDGPEAVPADRFHNSAPVTPAPQKTNFAPAPMETSQRVDFVGRKILAANPQTGVKPLFATIGSPNPEIFHQGTSMVWITAGLVGQCKSEADLAAMLSQELGKMVSEREASVSPKTRDPERLRPIEVPIGQAGNNSGPDMTYQAELGKFENRHPRVQPRLAPPDPQVLARMYLEKAGYQAADLDNIRPFMDAAEKNFAFERQIKGGPKQANWMP